MLNTRFISIILSFTLFSCYNIKEVTIIGIENFKVKKIHKEGMQTEIAVKIKNPNDFGFYVYSGKADISFSNLPLGKAQLANKIYIDKKSTATYHLLLNTSFDKISMQDIINTIALSGMGKVKINGRIKVGKFLFRKKITTNYEGNPLQMHFNNQP